MSAKDRRSVGDDVLEDLDAAIKSGTLGAIAPTARTYSTPTKLGREMIEGAGQTISRQKEAIERLEAERSDGMVVLRLDPKRIRASEFANRHERSLDPRDPAFVALKDDIRRRGQLDPIRVRPLTGVADRDYEIVYGHRRHAVAVALDAEVDGGFRVLALLDASAADAREHVLKMHSENFARSDLSPYEYGQMYASWLDAGCFKTQGEIATAVGLDQSVISTYVRIATLPEAVLAAFGDPRGIALRWARDLALALKTGEGRVLAAAAEIAGRPAPRDPQAVLRELVASATPRREARAAKTETVKVRGKTLYTMGQRGDGLVLKFGSLVDKALAAEARDELKEHLTRWLTKRVKS
jgi:ParB family transcriptional regulator, chromosome partitioning protein